MPILQAEGQDLPPPVWRAFGNQGNVWTMARLQIPVKTASEGYKVGDDAQAHVSSYGKNYKPYIQQACNMKS